MIKFPDFFIKRGPAVGVNALQVSGWFAVPVGGGDKSWNGSGELVRQLTEGLSLPTREQVLDSQSKNGISVDTYVPGLGFVPGSRPPSESEKENGVKRPSRVVEFGGIRYKWDSGWIRVGGLLLDPVKAVNECRQNGTAGLQQTADKYGVFRNFQGRVSLPVGVEGSTLDINSVEGIVRLQTNSGDIREEVRGIMQRKKIDNSTGSLDNFELTDSGQYVDITTSPIKLVRAKTGPLVVAARYEVTPVVAEGTIIEGTFVVKKTTPVGGKGF